jgi:putative glutamine amidotransferase
MGRLYGNGTTLVNSLHELAIDRVARGFVATARCTVGVIEALESQTDDWFALGVQFHPEPDACQDTDLRLFEAFVDEVLAQGSAAPARAVPYYV